MTHGEIMDTLRKRPDIAELITATDGGGKMAGI